MSLEAQIERGTRARRGLTIIRELKTKPHQIAGIALAAPEDAFVLLTSQGKETIIHSADVRLSDRYTNGSFVVDQEADGTVVAVWKNASDENKNPTV